VGQLHALAEGGEHDGVVSDDVAAAEGVDADLGLGAFAGDALAAVAEGLGAELALLKDDLEQAGGGAAGGVLLEAVVHLHDLGVVVVAQHGGGAAGEREEEVHADGVVARPDAADLSGLGEEVFFLLGGVAGGADDEGLAVLRAEADDLGGGGVEAEVDDDVGRGDAGGEIVALVEGGDDGGAGFLGGGEVGLAHAALGSDDGDLEGHVSV